jgi:tRNA(Ile)-lysidine synthase
MKKLSVISYRALFFKHVYSFLGKVATPAELRGHHLIAVSGGLDSMALLWFASALHLQGKLGPVRAVFVHHHTRVGQDYDAQVVSDFCQSLGVPFEMLHASGLDGVTSNFEKKARLKRRELLLNHLNKGERLWLGHHLDDSYEWSLMQKYRSNNPKSTLGIPVRNGAIVRPFLCVTRAQIKTLALNEKIIYVEDPTNADTRFDRNFIRHELVPVIQKRYPRYLRHYAYLSNYLASIQHLNVSNRVDGNHIFAYEHGAAIQGHNFDQLQIQELLLTYSRSDRGEITAQIHKMLKAIDHGKKGPFHFSGRTEAYFTHNLLMIYNQGLKNHDQTIAAVLNEMQPAELEQLPQFTWKDLERAWENLLKSSDAMLNLPGLLLVLERPSICKTLNTFHNDSLFPQVSAVAKTKNYTLITTLKCLETWKRKKEKLPEKLRILPLWTLSNLFAFQA